MKKIAVLSDTHSFIDEKVTKYLHQCDEIWHGGDIGDEKVLNDLNKIAPVMAVYGNIDNQRIRSMVPENNVFISEGMKVLIRHIAGYPDHYNPVTKKLINEVKPDIVIAGHSHILKVIFDKKLNHLYINPGAAGISGFHKIRTLIRFKLEDKKISNMEIIEIKR